MYSNDRQALREQFFTVWRNFKNELPLDPIGREIAAVIQEHPEYHAMLANKDNIDKDFKPEDGHSNPFLHMAMHLAIREQVQTDRPIGISPIYDKLRKKSGDLEAEHVMMECLGRTLWEAQRANQPPSDQHYLDLLKAI